MSLPTMVKYAAAFLLAVILTPFRSVAARVKKLTQPHD